MWLDIFNEMRKSSGMSLDDLSAKSGVPKGTLAKITSGVTKSPPLETIRKLVYALGYSLDDLDTELKSNEKFSKAEKALIQKYRCLDSYGIDAIESLLEIEYRRCDLATNRHDSVAKSGVASQLKVKRAHGITEVTVFEQPAAAGLGNLIDEPPSHIEQYPSDFVPGKTNFGIVISGDSMEPRITNGCTVFVQAAPALDSNKVGIFLYDGQAYCKQLLIDEKSQAVKLHSFNSAYDDIIISPFTELRILGRVLGGYDPQTHDFISYHDI